MAASVETSFNDLLHADLEAELPDTDADVIKALHSYGVKFSKANSPASNAGARLNLLAGLMSRWLHAHSDDLASVWPSTSLAQQRILAAALDLDFDKDAASASWLGAVLRRLLGKIPQGATPQKRKAPDAGFEGQIMKPGAAAAADPASPTKLKSPRRKKAAKPVPPAKSSSSDPEGSSSASDRDDEPLDVGEPAAPARMPDILGSGPAFRTQVAARCARKWVPSHVFENDVPVAQRQALWKARSWSSKDRATYEKMIDKQHDPRHRGTRRENPTNVACPHRLSFAYSDDETLDMDALHLALVCPGEKLSDWAVGDCRHTEGTRGRAEYQRLLGELREAWLPVCDSIARDHQIGAPAVTTLFELIEVFLARRYGRFSTVLTGRVREEVLANVARQLYELRVYFLTFTRDLADRAPRRDYALQAQFAGSRYIRLLTPTINGLLGADEARHPGGSTAFTPGQHGGGGDGGGGGFGGGGYPGAPITPPVARRAILKPQSVSFGSQADASGLLPSAAAFASSPAGAGGWNMPWYSLHPAAYNGPGGLPFLPPAASQGFSPPGPAGSPAWMGHPGPTAGSVAATAFPGAPPLYAVQAPPRIKPEPAAAAKPEDLFASQPQHTYVTGEDCAIVPVNTVRKPACGCGNKHGAAYKPGLHATWDCPHRYIAKYGRCPGFLANGFRDPTQWNGNSLTRAAKAAWVTLIQAEDLPLPHGGSSRAPPFHL